MDIMVGYCLPNVTNVSRWMSSSPPHWLFPSSFCKGRGWKTPTGQKVKSRSPTTSLQQTREMKNNNCPINNNHFSHPFYPESIWPHLQHPFWEGTSATLRLETRWCRRTQSCKRRRPFAFLPPWQLLPSRPEEVSRKECLELVPALQEGLSDFCQGQSYCVDFRNMDESVYLHDISHSVDNVSEWENESS